MPFYEIHTSFTLYTRDKLLKVKTMAQSKKLLIRLSPIIFVFLWATGFPAARFGTTDAEPFTFLGLRFAIALILLSLIVLAFVRPRNTDWKQFGHSMMVGVLMHGLYLGGVFYAVSRGMPAGISALIVALQPFFTAFIAWLVLGERLSFLRAVFFATSLFGIYIVLFPDFDIATAIPGVTFETLVSGLVATLGISIGSVYQKYRVTSLNLWVGTSAQFLGAGILMLFLSLMTEEQIVVWTLNTVLSLAWLVCVLSIGAVALLMYLIKQGDSTSVASLFFLVPVVAFAMTWALFGEAMNATQIIGSLIVVGSVAVSTKYG
jgi:drug/metabolite transporter (DMT)-like permease